MEIRSKPIIFNSEMVRAILEGRKTQTRRPLRQQPIDILPIKNIPAWTTLETRDPNYGRVVFCRFGEAGDRLWVREKWAHDDPNCKDIHCGNIDHIWWYANEEKIVADSFAGEAHWRPSIFMPRWASRITLEIVDVRAERLQDISIPDAVAEGIPVITDSECPDPDIRYRALWNSIN
jgi:hypothetical protein